MIFWFVPYELNLRSDSKAPFSKDGTSSYILIPWRRNFIQKFLWHLSPTRVKFHLLGVLQDTFHCSNTSFLTSSTPIIDSNDSKNDIVSKEEILARMLRLFIRDNIALHLWEVEMRSNLFLPTHKKKHEQNRTKRSQRLIHRFITKHE